METDVAELHLQMMIDELLCVYLSKADSVEMTDIASRRKTWTFWRLCPVRMRKESLKAFCGRYVRRCALFLKINRLVKIPRSALRDGRACLTSLRFLLDDEEAWDVLMVSPGTHAGFLMSQVICGPLTQAYLDQAHGVGLGLGRGTVLESDHKILNVAFMGFKFKPHQWDYYATEMEGRAILFDMNCDEDVVVRAQTAVLEKLPFPTSREQLAPHLKTLGETVFGVVPSVADARKSRKEPLPKKRKTVDSSPRMARAYFDLVREHVPVSPLTINTYLRAIKEGTAESIQLFQLFFDRINAFLNPSRNSWFETFLVLFVNKFYKGGTNITPINRRHIGRERDKLCAASFECPYDVLLESSEKKELWPIAASIVGVPTRLHGSRFHATRIEVEDI